MIMIIINLPDSDSDYEAEDFCEEASTLISACHCVVLIMSYCVIFSPFSVC